MLESVTLIGGKSKKHERHESDFYPTPADCTHSLFDFIDFDKNETIWEPACGNGAISREIEKRGFKVISSDIRDSGYGTGQTDFLQCEKLANVVITNPPFNLSVEFIEHCYNLELKCFALLLKSTYWHSFKRYTLFNKTKPAYILPFTWRPNMCPERGTAPTMDFLWTVWLQNNVKATVYSPLEKSLLY